jgi:hypothetical protein
MVKKILIGVFLIGIIGAIVAGIVELASPSEHAFAQQGRDARQTVAQQGSGGQQRGRYQQQIAPNTANDESDTESYGRGRQTDENNTDTGTRGYGRGRQTIDTDTELGAPGYGQGQNRNDEQPSYAESQMEHSEWQTLEGTVVETAELVIETTNGEIVQVGLGPSNYRDSQGFVLNVGDTVRVSGYWESPEEDEFKATQVENLSMDTEITLRDASGRPMWAGQGRRGGQNNSTF